MKRRNRILFFVSVPMTMIIGFILATCATGITPPEPTEMAEIRNDLTTTFGSTIPCKTKENECRISYPTLRVNLKPFAIDVHEVTNWQYRYCVAKGGCTDPKGFNAGTGKYYDESYYIEDRYKDYPVVGVSHVQAEEYCDFVEKRLPTEAEFERVMSGPNPTEASKPLYLWGKKEGATDQFTDCASLNINAASCIETYFPREVKTTPGDSLTDGKNTIYDLAGNVQEWVADPYEEYVMCKEELPGSCADFFDPASCNNLTCKNQASCDCGVCFTCEKDTSDKYITVDTNSDGVKDSYVFIPRENQTTPDCYRVIDINCGPQMPPVCVPYTEQEQPLDKFPEPPTGTAVKYVIKGGSYADTSKCSVRISYRLMGDSDESSFDWGFRCAKDL